MTPKKNFNTSLLAQLEILCSLHVDERVLTAYVEDEGFSHEILTGRDGRQTKALPESVKLDRTRAEIARYATKLGIFSHKDVDAPLSGAGDEPGGDENWE